MEHVVMRIPLMALWDQTGRTFGRRGRTMDADDIATSLRAGPVSFVVADCGKPLTWIGEGESFKFWKHEACGHLVPPADFEGGVSLDRFPGGYFYAASMWQETDGRTVILLEKYH